jgi:hypothetical protein
MLLAGVVGGPLLCVALAVAITALFFGLGIPTRGPAAAAFFLGLAALFTVVIAAGSVLCYFGIKRLIAHVNDEARRVALRITALTPVRCSQCGGHAAVVAVGPEAAHPCPWCDAALLPAPDAAAAAAAAARDLVDAHVQHADALARAAFAPRRRGGRVPAPPAGWVLTAGGAVVRGTSDGVPVHAFNDLTRGIVTQRLEVPFTTGLAGETWYVRPAVEDALRATMADWGYSLPDAATASPARGFNAYVEGSAAARLAEVGATLTRLGPSDALLLDPAGLSLWRRVTGLTHAWSLLAEHHPTLAALAKRLARPAAPAGDRT